MKLLWFTEYILEKSRDITQAEFFTDTRWEKYKKTTSKLVYRQTWILKRKKLAHAYFERCIFPSLLAGKFAKCEQMLLPEQIKKKKAHAFVKRPYLQAGKFFTSNSF